MPRIPSRPAADEPRWARWPDQRLLDLRFCDLKLTIKSTPLEARVGMLYRELEARRIRFRPQCWLAEEWFSPDGVPGIGIPFYLAHPRLTRLERKLMLEVEGGGSALVHAALTPRGRSRRGYRVPAPPATALAADLWQSLAALS